MAKVYVCDACGQVIEHPHSQKMKEFCLEANCDMGMAFAKPVEKKKGNPPLPRLLQGIIPYCRR